MAPSSKLVLDGAHGEGGGQILRTAVALAPLTGRPVRIERIRGRRPRPGLAPQHLIAVRAAAEICGAHLAGDEIGSMELEFVPAGPPRAGEYAFDVAEARAGSAGAVSLVLQTVVVPLAVTPGPSILALRGGTHVPRAPPFDYVRDVWLPALRTMGVRADIEPARIGWYPLGGGELRARIPGGSALAPLDARDRGALTRIGGRALTSRLPAHVGERMRSRALAELRPLGVEVEIAAEDVDAACPGAGLFLFGEYERSRTGSSALGRRGKPAEAVADEAVRELLEWHRTGAAIDAHLGDQLLLPAALASGPSELEVARATSHLRTNAWVIECFGLARVRISGDRDGPARVRIEPVFFRPA